MKKEYKKTAEFWNDCWKKTKFEDLPKEVQAELFDYHGMIGTWSSVAYEYSGGVMSKPNYTLDSYKIAFDEYIDRCIEDAKEELFDSMEKIIEKMKHKKISGEHQIDDNQVLESVLEKLAELRKEL